MRSRAHIRTPVRRAFLRGQRPARHDAARRPLPGLALLALGNAGVVGYLDRGPLDR